MKKGLKVLVVLLMMLCFAGCELKPKTPENKPDVNESEIVLKITGDTKVLDFFDQILSISLKFNKDSKRANYNIVSCIIDEEGKATVRFEKENIKKEDPEEEKYDIRNIKLNEKAVATAVSYDSNTKEAYVYLLTENNKLYLVTLTKESEPKTVRYDIPDIDSIATMNGCIETGKTDNHPMIFIKTTNEQYYTDYPFSTDNGRVLREIKKASN